MVVFEADGLGEELLHHAFLVVLQQGFLLDQLLNPPIHRRQEIRNLPLLGERGKWDFQLFEIWKTDRLNRATNCDTLKLSLFI